MLSKKTLALVVSCVVLILLAIITQTGFLFEQSSIQSVRVYWKGEDILLPVPNTNIAFSDIQEPNYTISQLNFQIDDAFSNTIHHFFIFCENLELQNNFFIDSNGFWPNMTAINEYQRMNNPDIAIVSPFIENDTFFEWIAICNLFHGSAFDSTPFLHRTSFDTYQCDYTFDGSYSTTRFNNDSFASADVNLLSFTLTIPKNFEIINIESLDSVEPKTNGYVITRNLVSGETFHLVIRDQTLTDVKTVLGIVDLIGIPATGFGLFITGWYQRKK